MTCYVVNIAQPVAPGRKRISIMRPGPWGNPFRLGLDGLRDEVIAKYRKWLFDEIKAKRISLASLRELDGFELACVCHPKKCHGEVLASAVEWALNQKG